MLRSQHRTPEVRGAPLWMITWADMMTLLLACFVLMAAFSKVNGLKFQQAFVSLQDAFGASAYQGVPFGEGLAGTGPPPAESVEGVARELQRKTQVMGREEALNIEYCNEGLRIVLPDPFLFDRASAEIKPESYPVLQAVAELLASVPECVIDVRGHTDNGRLTGAVAFRDNYDLSHARADGIARRLQAYGRIPLDRFEIVACGPGQPIATNDTEAGRQANGRVEILVRAANESSRMTRLETQLDQSQRTGTTALPAHAP